MAKSVCHCSRGSDGRRSTFRVRSAHNPADNFPMEQSQLENDMKVIKRQRSTWLDNSARGSAVTATCFLP